VNKTVLKKNGIEALHSDRDALKKEKTFTFHAARGLMRRPRAVRESIRGTDATTESSKRVNGRTVDNAGSFNGNWSEMIRLLLLLLLLLSSSSSSSL